ncbi:mannose-1-phosphate guanyltransferase alpha isoform 2 [Hibiscus syriacus]|uniref:Mannose-1-phosphate guanyltransferase alpha isoform 2 n=1 Tax=Hibiscus syriacus TaxID=106335 RepID=A0A6A3C6M6_HIBSY|nr:mannose-1-phosphate guanyltransferase alpha isoform 2 [Hibiscus syriacus]
MVVLFLLYNTSHIAGTCFRPLSLNVAKPLFPLAGQPMIPNLAQIYLVGFYEEREFALYVSSISTELRVPVSFPLPEMLEAHKRYGGMGTILVIKVSAESANQFGELVADPVTNELLHYTEKPETFVSDRINCGVYVFTPYIFDAIQANLRRLSSFKALQSATRVPYKKQYLVLDSALFYFILFASV